MGGEGFGSSEVVPAAAKRLGIRMHVVCNVPGKPAFERAFHGTPTAMWDACKSERPCSESSDGIQHFSWQILPYRDYPYLYVHQEGEERKKCLILWKYINFGQRRGIIQINFGCEDVTRARFLGLSFMIRLLKMPTFLSACACLLPTTDKLSSLADLHTTSGGLVSSRDRFLLLLRHDSISFLKTKKYN